LAGRLVQIVPGPTMADGLGGNPDPDTITFEPIQQLVDVIVTVSEQDLASTLVGLAAHEHVVAEGAGAAAPAAIAAKRIGLAGRHVATVVTGANIDLEKLARLLSAKAGHPVR